MNKLKKKKNIARAAETSEVATKVNWLCVIRWHSEAPDQQEVWGCSVLSEMLPWWGLEGGAGAFLFLFWWYVLIGVEEQQHISKQAKTIAKKRQREKKHAMSDFQRHTVDKASDCPACLGRRFVWIQLAERKPKAITNSDCRQSRPCPTRAPPQTPAPAPTPPPSRIWQQSECRGPSVGDKGLGGESGRGGGCLWSGDKVD